MREYQIDKNGGLIKAHYIGINYDASGVIDDVISTYRGTFNNDDEVIIKRKDNTISRCVIGDIMEAYAFLREEIWSKQPFNIFEYAECIQQVIWRYFGNSFYAKKRHSYFPDDTDIEISNKKLGKVSDIAHKNMALDVERAMVAHNLLASMGFNTVFKMSMITINGKTVQHAFNLVKHDGKQYIFDVSIPTVVFNKINPMICEIPYEVYEKMSSPIGGVGCNYSIKYVNALQNVECDITYDSLIKEKYIKEETYTKKKGKTRTKK